MPTLALMLLLATLPGWMSGTWRITTDGATSEETWSHDDGTTMTGMHRDLRPGKKTWFEFLRIEQRGDSLVYIAMPGGRPPTEFPLKSAGDLRIEFENPEHDFPRRIRYWRDGVRLCARVEGEGEKAEQWCWERVAGK